jgi:molybdopterin-synthase adenylyltransferase
MTIRQKKIKIKESVDVYQIPINDHLEKLQFYKINTREKSSISVTKEFSLILSKLDGQLTLGEILDYFGFSIDENELLEIFDYLFEKGYTISSDAQPENSLSESDMERYSRQINYFDDLIPSRPGFASQNILSEKEVTIIGCGAVGGAIAVHLARSGVKKLTLVDYKDVRKADSQRHIYYRKDEIGNLKTNALARYIKRINKKCNIKTINIKLLPSTDLTEIIDHSTDIVINSADEPYIGHITLKIGRFLWPKKIALYTAGGFDAHSMSTGEFIINGLTPCADCCSNTFRIALKDWTPTYVSNYQEKTNLVVGGSGGIASQALFSASIGSMNIISYLLGDHSVLEKLNKRGEYLLNQGKMTWIKLNKQEKCNVCYT